MPDESYLLKEVRELRTMRLIFDVVLLALLVMLMVMDWIRQDAYQNIIDRQLTQIEAMAKPQPHAAQEQTIPTTKKKGTPQ